MFRFFLKGALVARLLSEASWKANPGYADVEITRPIFVTGLPHRNHRTAPAAVG